MRKVFKAMQDFYSMFSEFLSKEKPNSVNTRESYLRDTMNYLSYLSQIDITPLEADERDVQGFVDHLQSMNRSTTTISRNLASVRCFYKFLIYKNLVDHNPDL